jgi:hypothetical protein
MEGVNQRLKFNIKFFTKTLSHAEFISAPHKTSCMLGLHVCCKINFNDFMTYNKQVGC